MAKQPKDGTRHRQGVRVAEPPLRGAKPRTNDESGPAHAVRGHRPPTGFVDDTGIEPVTSSVSRKRATTAPIARVRPCSGRWSPGGSRGGDGIRTRVHGFAGRCLASRPLHHRVSAYRPVPSGRPGSNRRPQPWQGCALPTELRPHHCQSQSEVPVCLVREQNSSALSRPVKTRYPGVAQGLPQAGNVPQRSHQHHQQTRVSHPLKLPAIQ